MNSAASTTGTARHAGSPTILWGALLLSVLAALPYLRSLTLPLMSDDYLLILQSREWGPRSAWLQLWNDSLYRSRAWSILLHHAFELLLGRPAAGLDCRLVSLGWHIVNTWLVALLGCWRPLGWRISLIAAAFFAVYEGHQEAVIWYSAIPDLHSTFCILLTVLCWIRWLDSGGGAWLIGSFIAFVAGLFAKEPVVMALPLMIGIGWWQGLSKLRLFGLLSPFALTVGVYALAIFTTPNHLHLGDGTFSFAAPFWKTWLFSYARLLWFWGALASLIVWLAPRRNYRNSWWIGAAWTGVTLFPYIFLLYMPRIPSRHTYLPSVGLGIMVAAGAWAAYEWMPAVRRRWLAPAIASLVVIHNAAYVLTVKHRQFVVRVAPTEVLLDYAHRATGPFRFDEFPYSPFTIEHALKTYAAPHTYELYEQGLRNVPGTVHLAIDKSGQLRVLQ